MKDVISVKVDTVEDWVIRNGSMTSMGTSQESHPRLIDMEGHRYSSDDIKVRGVMGSSELGIELGEQRHDLIESEAVRPDPADRHALRPSSGRQCCGRSRSRSPIHTLCSRQSAGHVERACSWE